MISTKDSHHRPAPTLVPSSFLIDPATSISQPPLKKTASSSNLEHFNLDEAITALKKVDPSQSRTQTSSPEQDARKPILSTERQIKKAHWPSKKNPAQGKTQTTQNPLTQNPLTQSALSRELVKKHIQGLKQAIHREYAKPQHLSLEKMKTALLFLAKHKQLSKQDINKLTQLHAANYLQRRTIFSSPKPSAAAPSGSIQDRLDAFTQTIGGLFQEVELNTQTAADLLEASLTAIRKVSNAQIFPAAAKKLIASVSFRLKHALANYFVSSGPELLSISLSQTKPENISHYDSPIALKHYYADITKELIELKDSLTEGKSDQAVQIKLSENSRAIMLALVDKYKKPDAQEAQNEAIRGLFQNAQFFDYAMDLEDTFFVLNLLADHNALAVEDLKEIIGSFNRQPELISTIKGQNQKSPFDQLSEKIASFVNKTTGNSDLRRAATGALLESVYKSSMTQSRKLIRNFVAQLEPEAKKEVLSYPISIQIGNKLTVANRAGRNTRPFAHLCK